MTMREPILLVDDDLVFCQVMERALTRRGYQVLLAHSLSEAETKAGSTPFLKALVDLKIAQDSGLALIKILRKKIPDIQIIILTGYSSVSTAVEAIKLGAIHYFPKPIDLDEVLKAFIGDSLEDEDLPEISTPSLDRIEWEHIQKVLMDNEGNVSATARSLGMHRRTLQRKLQKRPNN